MDDVEETHSLGAWAVIEKRDRAALERAGISSVEALAVADPGRVAQKTGLSEPWIRSLKADARDYLKGEGVDPHLWTVRPAPERQTGRDSSSADSSVGKAVAVLIINLVIPGLGSVLGGHLLAGTAQLGLLVGGGVLTLTLIGAIAGVPLVVLAWIWAVWTGGKRLDRSIENFRQHR